jgi:hypothetical protein
MKNNDDIPTTDTTEIKRLINRVKQGEFNHGDGALSVGWHGFGIANVLLAHRGDTINRGHARIPAWMFLCLRSHLNKSLKR